MNNSFSVAGSLLNALHLPECEGAEFELGICVKYPKLLLRPGLLTPVT
jgi:hypothetical protein